MSRGPVPCSVDAESLVASVSVMTWHNFCCGKVMSLKLILEFNVKKNININIIGVYKWCKECKEVVPFIC